MFTHEQESQIQTLIDAGLIKKTEKEKARKVFEKFWSDKVAIVWMVEDVTHRAIEIGKKITDKEAADLLQTILHEHDACMGVCWETFDIYLEDYPDMTEEEKSKAEDKYLD